MAANNQVTLIGNLTRNPEIRVMPQGTSIASFSVAVSRRWKDQNGQQRDETTFVECEMWGKGAEVFAKYHGKGRQCAVTGRLKLDQWEDKETKAKKSKLKVVVEDFAWLNSGKKSEGASDEGGDDDAPSHGFRAPPRSAQPSTSNLPQGGFDDDVPF